VAGSIDLKLYQSYSFCDVKDSMSTNYENNMWTEISNPCKLGSQNC